YALFLASRRQDRYPYIGEVHMESHATPSDLVDALRTMATLLIATINDADPDTQAIIQRNPEPRTGSPQDFAARGALEMSLHAFDVCSGLGVELDVPRAEAARLLEHTKEWPGLLPHTSSAADPWHAVLERSGRTPS